MSNTASDQHQLMSVDDDSTCCCTCRPGSGVHCTFDMFSLFSVIFLIIGLTLITIGYAIPRDYKFDPHKPARVMEAIEVEYARKRFALNVCIMVGTGFVTLSGLIISFIVTWELCSNENEDNHEIDPERHEKPPSYGSICGDREMLADEMVASTSEGAGITRNSRAGS